MFLYRAAQMSSATQENGLGDGRSPRTEGIVQQPQQQQQQQQDENGKRKSRVNWIEQELLVLQAARREDMQRYAVGGSKAKKQKTGDQRWKAITEVCASAGVERTPAQCKDKWESLHAEWKRIYNYEKFSDISPVTTASYWDLTSKQRKAQRLPTSFFFSVYDRMAAWCGQPMAVDSEEIFVETDRVRDPEEDPACKSSPTTSVKEEDYELFGGHQGGVPDDDTSNLPTKQNNDEESPGLSVGERRGGGGGGEGGGGRLKESDSLHGLMVMLEKNNEMLVRVMSTSEEKKAARHQELMKFEREKFLQQSELARRKLELSEQLGLGYINALHNIGDNIKLLGQAIMHGTKDLNMHGS